VKARRSTGIKTTPKPFIVGTIKAFLTGGNAHGRVGYGPNLNDEESSFPGAVIVVRKENRRETICFRTKADSAKVIRVSGTRYTICRRPPEKGTAFGQSQGQTWFDAHYAIFRGLRERNATVNSRRSVHARYVQSDLRSRDRRHADGAA